MEKRAKTDRVVIHHTAGNRNATVADVHQMHLNNGWVAVDITSLYAMTEQSKGGGRSGPLEHTA
nr:hypothetical protein [Desulforamulus aquiferis]